ncbi:hypothetical protein GPM19_15190 [Halomonas sp. ZH2S]|uniref:Uncharacterized protein n=1 Tax=Vreelandella zhuhanensis TaxID=2684210 RepID=A0A7X3H2U6_9GAMM|nr:hypothetical protein [Halomonas zhuhanensis]MWJ29516.1 hypothetical protein [Halomonas zhuhanensis]
MLKLTQNDLTIEVRTQQDLEAETLDAVVVPATEDQRRDLGKAAEGQAWMTWSPGETTPKTIKFMPPTKVSESGWEELLMCYRFAMRVAEIHEIASLALPLPEQVGLPPVEDALAARLSLTIWNESKEHRHLKHLHLVANDNQEAVLYAHWLVEVQSGHVPSPE